MLSYLQSKRSMQEGTPKFHHLHQKRRDFKTSNGMRIKKRDVGFAHHTATLLHFFYIFSSLSLPANNPNKPPLINLITLANFDKTQLYYYTIRF